MSHLPIWFLGQMDADSCDRVVAELCQVPSRDAVMGIDGNETDHSTRDTTVRFADPKYWLSQVFDKVAEEANKVCGWDYEITTREAVQFAEYRNGQHYAWHTDIFTLSGNPIDRKITVVALLNDGFDGGEFDIRLYSEYRAPLTKGTIICFPSVLEHRVLPVTSGVRYSATMWLSGPRFR